MAANHVTDDAIIVKKKSFPMGSRSHMQSFVLISLEVSKKKNKKNKKKKKQTSGIAE